MTFIRSVTASGLAAAAATLAACASTPPPAPDIAAARAAVTRAQPEGARYAPEELLSAQAKLAQAERAMHDGDDDLARRLAEQARVDAALASAIADSEQAREALAEVKRGIETLKRQLEEGKS